MASMTTGRNGGHCFGRDSRTNLPIIDPHHHLWERPAIATSSTRSWLTCERATISGARCSSSADLYRKTGPTLMAPVSGVDSRTALPRWRRQNLRQHLVCAGILGTADLRAGAEVAPILDA
jgi:hypothetical protein